MLEQTTTLRAKWPLKGFMVHITPYTILGLQWDILYGPEFMAHSLLRAFARVKLPLFRRYEGLEEEGALSQIPLVW